MEKVKWIIFAVVVIGILGGVFWLNRTDQVNFSGDASNVITEGPISDRSKGSAEQKVVLIEYGDYQCPGCASIHQPLKALVAKYNDKLTFIFRNLPLTTIHPNALAAASAAEAAGQQNKFWEMHDLLYQTQTSWSQLEASQRGAVFESYAIQVGTDLDKFKQDLASQEVADKISRDRTTSRTYNADSTPTFVINGQKFTGGATDSEAVTKAVEDALKVAYPDFQPGI